MLERFRKSDVKYIKECAEAIHSIENGTANQRTINEMFNPSDFFTDLEDGWEENLTGIEDARYEVLKGNYRGLVGTVKHYFPETDKAYLPFLIADLMREAYAEYNSEVKENV